MKTRETVTQAINRLTYVHNHIHVAFPESLDYPLSYSNTMQVFSFLICRR